MNRMKKSAVIMLAAACAVASGCGEVKTGDGSADMPADKSVSAADETTKLNEMKTIEPPEDGWTWDKIKEVIYINGTTHNYPLTLNELGDEFVPTEIKYPSGELVYTSSLIQYNGANFGYASFEYEDGKELSRIDEIATIVFSKHYNENNDGAVCINGVQIGSDTQDLISALGEPDAIDDEVVYSYQIDETFRISFSAEDKIIRTIFMFWDK